MTNEEAIKRLKSIRWEHATNPCPDREALDMAIEALKKRPTGKWIEKEDYNLDTYYECSECGADYCIEGDILIHKYCPNCGAKMDEVETEVEDDQ